MTSPNSYQIHLARSNIVSQEALNTITNKVFYDEASASWTPQSFTEASQTSLDHNYETNIEHFCAPVVHPVTGERILKYQKLMSDPVLRDIWNTAFGKEFGNMVQGDMRTGEKGTNSISVMSHNEIRSILKDLVVTYASIAVDHHPQKEDPNRVRITAGGNLIKYPGKLTTRTANLTTSKVLWNSVLSTVGARFMVIDTKSFYLGMPPDNFEYMKIPLSIFPQHIINQYHLSQHEKNEYVYLESRQDHLWSTAGRRTSLQASQETSRPSRLL